MSSLVSGNGAPAPPAPFVGRAQELSWLERALTPGEMRALVPEADAAGIGRTSLVQALAERTRVFDAVFWWSLPLDGPWPHLALRRWALRCGQDVRGLSTLGGLRRALAEGLPRAERALLVVDDVTTREATLVRRIAAAAPSSASVVITAADVATADGVGARPVLVEALLEPEALEMLERMAERKLTDREAAGVLDATARLPLALRLEGARLRGVVPAGGRNPTPRKPLFGPAAAVQAFLRTYVGLPEDLALTFRALGAFHYGPISAPRLASLLGIPDNVAAERLYLLQDAGLLSLASAVGHLQLHPMFRSFAEHLLEEAGEGWALQKRRVAQVAEAGGMPRGGLLPVDVLGVARSVLDAGDGDQITRLASDIAETLSTWCQEAAEDLVDAALRKGRAGASTLEIERLAGRIAAKADPLDDTLAGALVDADYTDPRVQLPPFDGDDLALDLDEPSDAGTEPEVEDLSEDVAHASPRELAAEALAAIDAFAHEHEDDLDASPSDDDVLDLDLDAIEEVDDGPQQDAAHRPGAGLAALSALVGVDGGDEEVTDLHAAVDLEPLDEPEPASGAWGARSAEDEEAHRAAWMRAEQAAQAAVDLHVDALEQLEQALADGGDEPETPVQRAIDAIADAAQGIQGHARAARAALAVIAHARGVEPAERAAERAERAREEARTAWDGVAVAYNAFEDALAEAKASRASRRAAAERLRVDVARVRDAHAEARRAAGDRLATDEAPWPVVREHLDQARKAVESAESAARSVERGELDLDEAETRVTASVARADDATTAAHGLIQAEAGRSRSDGRHVRAVEDAHALAERAGRRVAEGLELIVASESGLVGDDEEALALRERLDGLRTELVEGREAVDEALARLLGAEEDEVAQLLDLAEVGDHRVAVALEQAEAAHDAVEDWAQQRAGAARAADLAAVRAEAAAAAARLESAGAAARRAATGARQVVAASDRDLSEMLSHLDSHEVELRQALAGARAALRVVDAAHDAGTIRVRWHEAGPLVSAACEVADETRAYADQVSARATAEEDDALGVLRQSGLHLAERVVDDARGLEDDLQRLARDGELELVEQLSETSASAREAATRALELRSRLQEAASEDAVRDVVDALSEAADDVAAALVEAEVARMGLTLRRSAGAADDAPAAFSDLPDDDADDALDMLPEADEASEASAPEPPAGDEEVATLVVDRADVLPQEPALDADRRAELEEQLDEARAVVEAARADLESARATADEAALAGAQSTLDALEATAAALPDPGDDEAWAAAAPAIEEGAEAVHQLAEQVRRQAQEVLDAVEDARQTDADRAERFREELDDLTEDLLRIAADALESATVDEPTEAPSGLAIVRERLAADTTALRALVDGDDVDADGLLERVQQARVLAPRVRAGAEALGRRVVDVTAARETAAARAEELEASAAAGLRLWLGGVVAPAGLDHPDASEARTRWEQAVARRDALGADGASPEDLVAEARTLRVALEEAAAAVTTAASEAVRQAVAEARAPVVGRIDEARERLEAARVAADDDDDLVVAMSMQLGEAALEQALEALAVWDDAEDDAGRMVAEAMIDATLEEVATAREQIDALVASRVMDEDQRRAARIDAARAALEATRAEVDAAVTLVAERHDAAAREAADVEPAAEGLTRLAALRDEAAQTAQAMAELAVADEATPEEAEAVAARGAEVLASVSALRSEAGRALDGVRDAAAAQAAASSGRTRARASELAEEASEASEVARRVLDGVRTAREASPDDEALMALADAAAARAADLDERAARVAREAQGALSSGSMRDAAARAARASEAAEGLAAEREAAEAASARLSEELTVAETRRASVERAAAHRRALEAVDAAWTRLVALALEGASAVVRAQRSNVRDRHLAACLSARDALEAAAEHVAELRAGLDEADAATLDAAVARSAEQVSRAEALQSHLRRVVAHVAVIAEREGTDRREAARRARTAQRERALERLGAVRETPVAVHRWREATEAWVEGWPEPAVHEALAGVRASLHDLRGAHASVLDAAAVVAADDSDGGPALVASLDASLAAHDAALEAARSAVVALADALVDAQRARLQAAEATPAQRAVALARQAVVARRADDVGTSLVLARAAVDAARAAHDPELLHATRLGLAAACAAAGRPAEAGELLEAVGDAAHVEGLADVVASARGRADLTAGLALAASKDARRRARRVHGP